MGKSGMLVGAQPTTRLNLFGGFSLQVGSERVDPPASAQRLVAFLALGGTMLRAAAAGALWPDRLEGQALASLRTTMWRANRCIPDLVRSSHARVGLSEVVCVDVDELVGNATRALGGCAAGGRNDRADDAGWLPELVSRHRHSELLPGWYDDWVIFERERLRHLRLHAMEATVARLTRDGRFALALDIALEAVRCEPLRESAQRAVITVHLAEGNVVEAMTAFERYRAMLNDELGLAPSRELVDLMWNGVHRRTRQRRRDAVADAAVTSQT